ncbi:hypothetical protein BK133_26415 [Paenibacillus sp. FSL H8-0548]|uniref:ComEA family DNA-binding protein n=1 Tax=Paenibacillus sp. FSL H8-0548 TaxID=1920422 RepID=UPI00096D6DA4|nr:ComEA family DNA-binding protein [Paenibacillus sp. FSL H8-0548]OMF22415.1 hypothetical protein BK133_26415 [Paenibacillus sp. FSL H8-0548]
MYSVRNGLSSKQLMLAVICILTAVILLATALMEPKQVATGEWIPLNEAVESAFASLDEPIAEEVLQESSDIADANHSESIAGKTTGLAPKENEAIAAEPPAPDVEPSKAMEAMESTAIAVNDGRLDINRATAAELDGLKGIGPAKAQAIIEDRERNGSFTSAEDLLRVKGIGEKLLQGIKESIVARP